MAPGIYFIFGYLDPFKVRGASSLGKVCGPAASAPRNGSAGTYREPQGTVQRLQVALWYIHRPQSYDVGITLRPMYLLYSYMEPLEVDSGCRCVFAPVLFFFRGRGGQRVLRIHGLASIIR